MSDSTNIFLIGAAGVGAYLLYRSFSVSANVPAPAAVVSGPGGIVPASSAPGSTVITNPPTAPAPPANVQTSPGAPVPPKGSGASGSTAGLTLQDATEFLYSPSIAAAQINALHDQLIAELKAGQILSINGKSVLAFMLGWGGAVDGEVKTVLGYTYQYSARTGHWAQRGAAR